MKNIVQNVTNLYAISTSVGSGKTHAAIRYMNDGTWCNQNFIYVAPTKLLLGQTAESLREVISKRIGQDALHVHIVHSDCRQDEGVPTWLEALRVIEEAADQKGQVIMLTTTTFLNIVWRIRNKALWRVILDEAFQPVTFYQHHLGKDVESGFRYFEEVFAIHPDKGYLITPAPGCETKVAEIASGNFERSGDQAKGHQGLAALVANRAQRCEVVQTTKVKMLLDARYGHQSPAVITDNPSDEDEGSGSILLVACYFTPEEFLGFKEVIFMAALFDRTILYYLWQKQFGIRFSRHSFFEYARLRDTHLEQGQYISIGHLLHPDDSTSKMNLSRNAITGEANESQTGQRVIDALVQAAKEYFKDQPFLLQANDGYDYERKDCPLLPSTAIKIPTLSHGLNDYKGIHHVAALAVTNPNPQEAGWVMNKTGLSHRETLMAYRIHTTYQAVGRTSIRCRSNCHEQKVFLVVGYDDAKLLHDIFPRSSWLGQVGNLPALSLLQRQEKADGVILGTTKAICLYLESLPDDIRRVSSRALKAAIAPDTAPRSWAKATGLVASGVTGWVRQGSSFVRQTFHELFGEDTEALAI